MVEAVTLLARSEGLMLNPVYSGRGMAGLTLATQHSLAASYPPAFLQKLPAPNADQNFGVRPENRSETVNLLMRGQAQGRAGATICSKPPGA